MRFVRFVAPALALLGVGGFARAETEVWFGAEFSEYQPGETLSDKGATGGGWTVAEGTVATNTVADGVSAIALGLETSDEESEVLPTATFTAVESAGHDFRTFDVRLEVTPQMVAGARVEEADERLLSFAFDDYDDERLGLAVFIDGTLTCLAAEGVVFDGWCDLRVRLREIGGGIYAGFFVKADGEYVQLSSETGVKWLAVDAQKAADTKEAVVAGTCRFSDIVACREAETPLAVAATWVGGDEGDWDEASNWSGGEVPAPGTLAAVTNRVRFTRGTDVATVSDALIEVLKDGTLALFSGSVISEPELDISRPRLKKPLVVASSPFAGMSSTFLVDWARGRDIGSCDNFITVSTENTYTPQKEDLGHWLRCKVTDEFGNEKLKKQFYFSRLPVLYMTTDDGKTPSAGKEEHAGKIVVQGAEKWKSPIAEEMPMTIKVRGNSTASYSKKPWKIKLDEKTKMFDIAKSKHWVLLANYNDESTMRNKLAADFANEIGSLGMESTWVECFLNGSWEGLYQFSEHIRIDKDRVNVFDWEGAGEDAADAIAAGVGLAKADKKALETQMSENFAWVTSGKVTYGGKEYDVAEHWEEFADLDITGGYLVESSEEYDEVSKFQLSSGNLSFNAMLNSPEYLKTNDAMMNWLKGYLKDYLDACTSLDGYAKGMHWSEYADIDSMTAYFLVMEMFGNDDAMKKSRYLYKDIGGVPLMFGPVWDFDWGVGNDVVTGYAPESWRVQDHAQSFYREWADDPWFCTHLRNFYWSTARAPFARMIGEGGEMDEYIAYLAEAGAANDSRWWRKRGFAADAERLRTYLATRLAWLDRQFADVPTLIGSLKRSGSTHPYTAASAKLPIAFANAPTNVVEFGEALELAFAVGDAAVTEVAVFANGLRVGEGSQPVANDRVAVSVPAEMLTEPLGRENCISLIGYNANGAVVGTNYALVIVTYDGEKHRFEVIIAATVCGDRPSGGL